MRWYKILARILLMLSVVDFAPAAPVVVREHGVRVSVVDAAKKDGTATSQWRWDTYKWPAPANLADRKNAPPIARSSDSGHWREQGPGPRSRRDLKGSAEPSNPALPPIDLYANNPPNLSPPPGPGSTSPSLSSHALTDESDPLHPSSPSDSNLGPLDDNLDAFPQPNFLKYKLLSELPSTPTHDTLLPDGFPHVPSLPGSQYRYLPGVMLTTSSVNNYPPNSQISTWTYSSGTDSGSTSQHRVPALPEFKPVSGLMATTPRVTSPPDGSRQISSSSDETYLPGTDSGSTSSESWSLDVSPPASPQGSSQGSVAAPPNPGDHLPPGRLSLSSALPTEEYYLASLDHLSTADSRPPIPGPTDNPPPPPSSSNPGPSTEPNPPPSSPKRPRPDESDDSGSFISKVFKGRLRRGNQGYFRGTFDSTTVVNSPATTSATSGVIDHGAGTRLPRLPGQPPEPEEIGIA